MLLNREKIGVAKKLKTLILSFFMVISLFNISFSETISAEGQSYWLVVGSYEKATNADAMFDKLLILDEKPEKISVDVGESNYTRILIGPFEDRLSALDHSKLLVSYGLPEPWITLMDNPVLNADETSAEVSSMGDIETLLYSELLSGGDLQIYEGLIFTKPANELAEMLRELGEEPDIRVGIYKTLNKTNKMTIGADFMLVVRGTKVFTDGSLPQMREVSMTADEFTLMPGDKDNEIKCESKSDGIVTFTGDVIIETAPDAVVPLNKFVWVNNKTSVYRGKFKFFRNTDKGITTVNVVPIESYIRGVLVAEIGADAHVEALCAQAIAIRTEVSLKSRHTSEGYDFCSSTHCQVYNGASSEYRVSILDSVIEKTRGEVMFYDGKQVTEAKFYSSCGGVTETSSDIWGTRVPHLISVNCQLSGTTFVGNLKDENVLREFINNKNTSHLCSSSSGYRWSYSYTKDSLGKRLDNLAKTNLKNPGAFVGLAVTNRSTRGAAVEVKVTYANGTFLIKGENAIRTELGGTSNIKSAVFIINESNGKIEFLGAGFGHGVGMCQIGARQMAKLGASYMQILTTYYTGVTIGRIFK